MLGFIEYFKTKYGIQVKYAQCDDARGNENLLTSPIEYVPSSMVGNFLPSWEMAYGLTLPAQPLFMKTNTSLQKEI